MDAVGPIHCLMLILSKIFLSFLGFTKFYPRGLSCLALFGNIRTVAGRNRHHIHWVTEQVHISERLC